MAVTTKIVLDTIKTTIEQNYLEREFYELLTKEESVFRFMQDFAFDGLSLWDMEHPENKWVNKKFWKTLGYNPEEIPKAVCAWQSSMNEEDLEMAKNKFTKHRHNVGYSYDQTIRHTHKLGHTIWMQVRGLVLYDQNQRPTRMLGAHIDVTPSKKTEVALKRQIKKYQHIIDGTNIGTWEWNVQSGETIFNEHWARIQGYSLAELGPTNFDTWSNLTHPSDVIKSKKLLQEHFSGRSPFYVSELRMRHKNGDWVWVQNKGKVISWTAEGEPEWVIGSHQEITETKKKLLKHKAFIEQAPTAIAMFDSNMCYLAYSQKWLIDYHIQDTDIIGKSHYEVFPEINEVWKKDHQDCLGGKILKSDEDRFVRVDGSIQWISWELRPWYYETNKIGGITMFTVDITHLKEIESKLRLSEETFRGNFENAAIGMAILSPKGEWIKSNTALCNILGYSKEELNGMSFRDVTHPEDGMIGIAETKDILNGKKSHFHAEKRYVRKDGGAVNAILSTSLVRDQDGRPKHFLAQINDITPRIVAQNKMQAALTKIEGLFEASRQVSIIATDTEGVITAFNKGAENLLGYSKEEMINKGVFMMIHSAEEIQKRGTELSKEFDQKIHDFEVFRTMAKSGDHHTQEWSYVRKDGDILPVQLTVTAIKEQNEITGYLGVASDISKIKHVENEIHSLLQVAKDQNKRLLNFAHIVSHNLKSHSGNFCMLLNLFLQDYQEFEDNEIIRMFKNASDNLSETIMHLNEVVLMNTSLNQGLVGLNLYEAIEKVMLGLSAIKKESSVTIKNLVNPSSCVMGVSAYLDSILLNFLTNGIKYRSKERKSHVYLTSSIEEEYLVLSIEDNGLGIDLNKNGDKLFGMYKTFHYNKDARGIGLFITKNQVEALGGKIEVSSEVNVGTIFKIYLRHEKN